MKELPGGLSPELLAARKLKAVAEKLPLSISASAVFAGSQNDAFSSSYALIHPSFKVEEFKGYCDPLAVFSDLGEEEGMTPERIGSVKEYYADTAYVRDLKKAYEGCTEQTEEALFFVEQVTGHLIPDFSRLIREGSAAVKADILAKEGAEKEEEKKEAPPGHAYEPGSPGDPHRPLPGYRSGPQGRGERSPKAAGSGS